MGTDFCDLPQESLANRTGWAWRQVAIMTSWGAGGKMGLGITVQGTDLPQLCLLSSPPRGCEQ
jgi:hypothetical protein